MARLAVLTARPDLPIYAELVHAGAARGHEVEVLDALKLVARLAPAGVLRGGEPFVLGGLAALLPRVGNWRPDATLAVLEALQAAGVPSLNAPSAIRRGRDHWRTVACLASCGLPHPETVTGSDPESLAAGAAAVLGFPCVVKQRGSRQGVGVFLCSARDQLDGVLESLWRLGDEVVVQRYCPPGGVSRRVLVLDGEPLGATEHRAAAGEFRSNAARGATVRAIALADELAVLAIAAASAVGLRFAGVDLFLDGERWVVGEVNPSPGWRHFAAATGVAVAELLVEALARLGVVA